MRTNYELNEENFKGRKGDENDGLRDGGGTKVRKEKREGRNGGN